jgi:RloB-like protein
VNRTKGGNLPQRRPSDAAKRRSILVFTEGTKTEPLYLTYWRRLYQQQVIVSIDDFHGAPLSLVKQAAATRKHDLREQRRERGDAYNEYWCVFDVDEFPNIPEALRLPELNDINIALSNPCIELWFLLHFQDQSAVIHRADAQRKAKELLGCHKVLTPQALGQLVELYPVARDRALKLDKKHEGDGSPSRSNPSSDLWHLIERIQTR